MSAENDATTSEQVEELLLLQRVAQRISSTLDLEPLLKQIVSDVAQTFGYLRSAVLLKDETTNELVIAHGWTGDQKHLGDRFEIGKSGIAGHVGATEQTHYAPDVRVDPFYEVGHPSTRSELDIPLKARDQLIGVFNVQHEAVDALSPRRIRLLEALAGHVATAVDNARMFQKERLESARMLKELRDAQAMQASLLPTRAPAVGTFTMDGVCLPCRTVGGDWFDYIPLTDDRLAVVLADVSGKGMAAALLMSSTRSILRLVARDGSPPAKVLRRVNEILLEDFPAARFVTMVYAVVDLRVPSVVFANAGHFPPLSVDVTGASFLDTAAGLPLGIRTSEFSEQKIRMAPGSRLVLYSDGVVEASNAALEEYGLARIRRHFGDGGGSVDSLLDDVRQFSGGNTLSDDATVVVLNAR